MTAPEKPQSPWESFLGARTSDQFGKAWLALVCQQLGEVRKAALLIEDAAGEHYVPLAVWPHSGAAFERLGAVVGKCLQDRKAVIQPVEGAATQDVAYPIVLGEKIAGVVVLETALDPGAVLRHLHWSSAWISQMLAGRELEHARITAERTASVLDTVAIALQHRTLQQALFETANTVARRFAGSRTALGLVRHHRVRLTALSEAATFEKHAALSKGYVAAMEETLDRGTACATTPEVNAPAAGLPAHAALPSLSGGGANFSCPLPYGAETVGILLVEKRDAVPFTPEERDWLEAFAAVLAPIVAHRREAERSSPGRLLSEGRHVMDRLFGPRHLIWKTAAALLLLTVILGSVVQRDYRISARTVIEGEVQRVAAAPFAGFIQSGFVRAGDRVRQGQALAALDDRELRLEETRWSSERDQYAHKLREALANHNLTDVQVIGAQLAQAEAQLAEVSDKIRRSRITAPFDGLVVTGDLSQQIGAPIELGKELFTIAPLASYRVILQVDERDIRHVRVGQTGKLVMIGLSGDPLPFTVSKVTPVASNQDSRNFFRVEAQLSGAPPRLRPGMEGVGKIVTDPQPLGWIMTHSAVEWLSLSAWKWLP